MKRETPPGRRRAPCYHPSVPSRFALIALVAANLVPLFGALVWDWSVAAIVVLYWLENGIIGLSNLVRMALASGPGSSRVTKAFLMPFFTMHYGLFWVVHGVFVLAFFGGGLLGADTGPFVGSSAGTSDTFAPFGLARLARPFAGGSLAWGLASLALSHAIDFGANYLGDGTYRHVTARELMMRPYGRVIVLHLAIIFGAFMVLLLGSALGALVVLVLVKTAIDMVAYRRTSGRPHRASVRPVVFGEPGGAPGG